MSQIIAVTKSGKDVLAPGSLTPNDYIFHSTYNSLKIIASGTFSTTVPQNNTGTYYFNHGLGYAPMVEGFCKVDSHSVAVCPFEGMGNYPFVFFFHYIASDASKIYVRLTNNDSSPHAFYIKYYIFEVPF